MKTEADIGYGTHFALGDGEDPEVFTNIAETFNHTPPNETTDIIDATNDDSENHTREFIPGLTDPGEASFEMNFLPGSESEDRIIAWRASRATRNCEITYPNGAVWSFAAFCTGYEAAVPTEDKMTATVSMKVTGSIVRESAGGEGEGE